MGLIHSTAIVDPAAVIGADVSIGPYAVIGPQVCLGAGCWVGAHAMIEGHTQMGEGNKVFPHAYIGGAPQDKKYAGELTRLVIGHRNTFRESVTVNTGTVQDLSVTTIGDDNLLMAYVHVAHDCIVGSNTVLANCTQLAGHVQVGDWAILGGFTGVHQFCKVGAHAMTGVGSVVLHDVPPFVMVSGNSAQAHGINTEGLKRRGFSAESIASLRRAYKTLYKNGLTLEQARVELVNTTDGATDMATGNHLRALCEFLAQVTRGIVR
jgi:UDP-N-acetylglucosamine acyltransferase